MFDWYRSLRKLGLSIDILPAINRDFEGYQLIVVPGMIHMPADLKNALSNTSPEVILGLHTCARDENFKISIPLPLNLPNSDFSVVRVQSLRPDMPIKLKM